MPLVKHAISFVSAVWVFINLLVGFALLLPIAIINLLVPIASVKRACQTVIKWIYRAAVRMDSFWMQQVMGIELVIKGKANTDPAPVVICNHQSWFDIPLVQEVIAAKGPIVQFLVKRELTWVPVIGWICLALNFPLLRRSSKDGTKNRDFSIIQKASKSHGTDSGALLVFPEGTRFSESKRTKQNVPYTNLLRPKSGGLKVIQKHAKPGTSLIDITIDYHQKDVNIWNCLHGDPRKITITLDHFELDEIDDIEAWLNSRWLEKDKLFRALD